MKTFITTIFLTLFATNVFAQSVCAPKEVWYEALESDYKETRQVIGLMNNGTVLEVYANTVTGTWTVLTTSPDGISCNRADGDNYVEVFAELEAPGTDG